MGDKLTDPEQQYPVKNPATQFLLEQVVLWLSEKGRTDTEHLVEIIFSSLSCCSRQETTCILNHISMVTKVEMSQINFCISLILLVFFCASQMELPWGIILQVIQRVFIMF